MRRSLRRDSRGDTIVEVLLALAVIGAVLGAAYVTANRNTQTNISSRERLAAIKLGESQLERLKAKVESEALSPTAALNRPGGFCLTGTNDIEDSDEAECVVDGSGNPTTGQPQYTLSITREEDYTDGATKIGGLFALTINWENVSGDHTDTLTLRYGVYR